MSYFNRKAGILISGIIAGMICSAPVMADDTEIYVGSNSGISNVPPNVLFVVDTSGSMDSAVITREPYDPNYDYSGNSGACYDNSRIYTKPDQHWYDCYNYSVSAKNYYFNASALQCNAAASLATTGFYQDRLAQWRGGVWKTISNSSRTAYVECKADNGIHGNGGSAVWASNSNGPWSTDQNDSVDWSAIGSSQTIYAGNYMNYLKTAPIVSSSTRINVVKDVVTNVVNSVQDINIGLMRFSRNAEGGMVVTPMGDIATNKTQFLSDLNVMTARGGTPLSESLYEAARYYQGKSVDYGDQSTDANGTLLSAPDSRTPSGGSQYKTPIEFQCQKNFIVLLTDGEPTSDYVSTSRLSSIGVSSCTGNCLDEIAGAMASQDQSTTFAEDQKVSTYTIGFTTDQQLLEDTADKSKQGSGAGKYFTADNASDLTNVFTNILTDILGVSSTFSSPAVSVNAFNRTSHRSDLYFTLFKPDTGPHWDGNLKRYKLAFATDGTPTIKDASGNDAVSDTTGFFRDSSISYWTQTADAPDGKEAGDGGAASRLTNTRKVYTSFGNADLTDSSNALNETNTNLTDAVLGITGQTSAYRDKLLKWARGIDVNDQDNDGSTTDARRIMGDPLHSQPALIQYGGPDSDPDLTAYVVTNDGYLHAFDTRLNAGTELFSFVPNELLDRLDVFYNDDGSVIKPYGLDGTVVPWVDDQNQDGIISGSDHVYIYFGMRRGGNNIYALDVTDRSTPKLKWVIKGGTSSFTELGQTWSKPTLRKILLGGQEKHVLIFGGGYDTNQDGASSRSTDSVGRAVYIVDADTGSLLWWASSQAGADLTLPDMKYSIPSDVAAVDSTGDGYVNMLYIGDMGGQIWRFDIARGDTASDLSSLVTGGRIAELAGNNSASARRFYSPPDAAVIKNKSNPAYISLIITSGYRAHPLNTTIEDRIYMLKDTPIKGKPTSYTTITESDLFDTTDNTIGQGTGSTVDVAQQSLDSASGWMIKLEDTGEKGLSRPLIFDGKAFITSYIPNSSAGTSCMPSEGSGRLYIVHVADGTPVYNFDTVESNSEKDLTRADRPKALARGGIQGDPTMIRTDDENQKNMTGCVGTECFEVKDTNTHKVLYHFEE